MDMHRADINITADEINALIHSYLVDSGFIHSAFVLRGEANLDRSPLATVLFPRGQLTELLAKALLYTEVETHWKQPPGSCNEPFSLTGTHTCKIVPGRDVGALATSAYRMQEDSPDEQDEDDEMEDKSLVPYVHPPGKNELPPAFQHFLPSHQGEIFQCSWNPIFADVLVTGSKDSTAVVWKVDLSMKGVSTEEKLDTLRHCLGFSPDEERDVSCIEWSRDGMLLATSSMDHYVRVWNKARNRPLFTFKEHTDTIGLVRFSPNGKYLLSQGLDLATILWDMEKAKMVRKYYATATKPAGLQDITWVNDTSFAVTWPSDYTIQIFIVTAPMPFRIFRGHKDELNMVRVSPDRKLLASGGDDFDVRIWTIQPLKLMVVAGEFVPAEGSVGGEAGQSCLHVLRGHTASVMHGRWVPSTFETPQKIFVSCGDDYKCFIWDTDAGTCLKVLKDHTQDIYGLSISPDAQYYATASMDQWLYVYSAEKNWEMVMSWTDRSPQPTKERGKHWPPPGKRRHLYEVDWHRNGKRLAVCIASGNVAILDVSHLDANPAIETTEP